MEQIRDGIGRGNLAAVNNDNKLEVRAISVTQAHFHSDHKANVFVTTFEHDITVSGTKEIIGVFNYTGADDLVVSRIGLNTAAAGRTAFYLYLNPEGISGGTAATLNNTNAGSRYNINANLLQTDHGDYPITYTSLGDKMWEIYAGYHTTPHYDFHTDNAIILRPGTSLAIVAKSEATGDKVGANMLVFEDDH
jgi:hypothetical protein